MSLLKTRAELSVDEILTNMAKTSQQLLLVHRQGFKRVWENSITPDEVVAQMGNRAAGIMGAAWKLVELLLMIDPDIMQPSQYLPRRQLQFNEDGTVTLAPPPEGFDAWGRPIPEPEPE